MGYMVHHTFVVSSWDVKLLRRAQKKAKELFSKSEHFVSNVTPAAVNGYHSFFVAPDGSKAGWDDSVEGWKARKAFVRYLKKMKPYPPGWVLVQFDDDGLATKVIDSNDHYSPDVSYFEGKISDHPKPEPHTD